MAENDLCKYEYLKNNEQLKEEIRKNAEGYWTIEDDDVQMVNRFAFMKSSARGVVPPPPLLRTKSYPEEELKNLPNAFDAGEKWPHCNTIGRITSQGSCSSCWAMASTEVMSDRICIHGTNLTDLQVSAEDLVECIAGRPPSLVVIAVWEDIQRRPSCIGKNMDWCPVGVWTVQKDANHTLPFAMSVRKTRVCLIPPASQNAPTNSTTSPTTWTRRMEMSLT